MATSRKVVLQPARQQRAVREMRREWAQAFRRARVASKFTQVDLGRRLGLGGRPVSAWEIGSTLPTPEEWKKVKKLVPDVPPLPDLTKPAPVLSRSGKSKSRKPKPAIGPYAEFANRLRAARTAANLTRVQLAKAVKASGGSVANWETGGHLPQHAPMQRLRVALATQWGAPEDPNSLAAWEASLPKVSGRLLRRRGPSSELGILRAKASEVPGAYGFLTRFVDAVGERRLTGTQVGLFLGMLRQFERRDDAAAATEPEAKAEPKKAPAKKAAAKKATAKKA